MSFPITGDRFWFDIFFQQVFAWSIGLFLWVNYMYARFNYRKVSKGKKSNRVICHEKCRNVFMFLNIFIIKKAISSREVITETKT
jgi:hypothetical protein